MMATAITTAVTITRTRAPMPTAVITESSENTRSSTDDLGDRVGEARGAALELVAAGGLDRVGISCTAL